MTSTSFTPRRDCAESSGCCSAPTQLRTFVVSRRYPKLGLHRLRLAGELTEIRAADLEFAPEEAGELRRRWASRSRAANWPPARAHRGLGGGAATGGDVARTSRR